MDENAVKTEKRKLPLTHSAMLKAVAFIMTIIFLAVLAAGVLGAALMWEYGVYDMDKQDFYDELYWGYASSDAHDLCYYVGINDFESVGKLLARRNIEAAEIICSGAQDWTWSYGGWEDSTEPSFERTWFYCVTEEGHAIPTYDRYEGNYMLARLRLAEVPTVYDGYWLSYWVAEITYAMMYGVYLMIVLAFAACVLCVIYLLNAAGHRRKTEGVTPSWSTWIPFDLLTAIVFFLGVGSFWLCDALMWRPYNEVLSIMLVAAVIIVDVAIALGWLMSVALRIKLRTIFSNTIIFMLLRLIWRGVKWCWHALGCVWRGIRRTGERIALFWKAALIFVMLCILEFAVIMMTQYNAGLEVFFWFIARLVLLAGIVYICHMLRELYNCGKAVAAGDLDYKVDTRAMPSQFREHAENMRSLSVAVNKAVEQRMVSERMKTELITNVSHDLKTPLTSLINYSDLVCRESCDNPHHAEYAQVLHRQSERLKRLIDDLVEASKASTGNLEVNLAPCEAGVMLMQVAGEYEQRLQEKGLQLVAGQPVHPITIMADGRRLWRVMDNLMNNICKYALCGTRVYLSLEDMGSEAVLSFKNTSRDQLNLSPDELMERFVRGDASRGSEGSGLGLSIARSLTELQGGKMEIVCDGDLFKVVLRFPIVGR